MTFDRQPQADHVSETRRISGNRDSDFVCSNRTSCRLDARNGAGRSSQEAGNLTVLDNINAAVGGTARISPNDSVVPGRTTARLKQSTHDRKTSVIEIEKRRQLSHAFRIQQFSIDAVKAHRIATPGKGVALPIGMIKVENAALAHHGVVVEILFKALPQLH